METAAGAASTAGEPADVASDAQSRKRGASPSPDVTSDNSRAAKRANTVGAASTAPHHTGGDSDDAASAGLEGSGDDMDDELAESSSDDVGEREESAAGRTARAANARAAKAANADLPIAELPPLAGKARANYLRRRTLQLMRISAEVWQRTGRPVMIAIPGRRQPIGPWSYVDGLGDGKTREGLPRTLKEASMAQRVKGIMPGLESDAKSAPDAPIAVSASGPLYKIVPVGDHAVPFYADPLSLSTVGSKPCDSQLGQHALQLQGELPQHGLAGLRDGSPTCSLPGFSPRF